VTGSDPVGEAAMIEVRRGVQAVALPYTLRLYGVSEDQFQELADEDTRAELLDGVMVVHSPATIEHDDVGGFVRALMRIFARRRRLGKVLGPDSLVHLKTCRLLAPDAYFVEKKRAPTRKTRRLEGAPNLVVEVLSPSDRDFDLNDKRPAYQAGGVGEIWFLDPVRRVVLIDRKRGRHYEEETLTTGKAHSAVLAGFWIDVGWLWQDPLPDELDCLQQVLGEG
jgi:Uma2 family endonuclease